MLLPYLAVLNSKKIVLGSQSKSRNQLLTIQKLNYERIPSEFVEDLDKQSFDTPSEYNLQTCRGKAEDLLKTFKELGKQWDLLICGDTIVYHQGKIIEKPMDEKECVEMMGSLSGNTHQAYTAHVVVFNVEPQLRYQWVTKADVTFGQIPIESLKQFSKTEQPYIHSGGYELTAMSGSFLKSINGSHTAVQGLDMHELCSTIIKGAQQAKWIN